MGKPTSKPTQPRRGVKRRAHIGYLFMFFFFFFQAADGIRVLVQSRGLGDVYRGQGETLLAGWGRFAACLDVHDFVHGFDMGAFWSVAYTHLTLPTTLRVIIAVLGCCCTKKTDTH